MGDYLEYLSSIYDEKTFQRKLGYLRYNFGRHFRAGQTVLEIGPGLGEFIVFCNERGIDDIDIIDRDEGIAGFIKQKYKVRNLWVSSAEAIPKIESELRRYDRIFMLHIMEHVEKPDVIPVIQALYRRLKVGGALMIIVPNGGTPLAAIERYHDFTHEGCFSENSLRQIVGMANLPGSRGEVFGYHIPPVHPLNILRIIVQKTLHLCLKLVMIANGSTHLKLYTPHLTLMIHKDRE